MDSQKLDWKHIVAIVLGIALGVAGGALKYDFKGDLCSGQPVQQAK